MALFRTVARADGTSMQVQMSAEEEAATLAEWAANDAMVVVPNSIEGWRGRTVMELHGLDAAIRQYINGLPGQSKTIAKQGYNSAAVFQRDSQLLNAVLKGLGKTEAEIDAYFIEAAALPN